MKSGLGMLVEGVSNPIAGIKFAYRKIRLRYLNSYPDVQIDSSTYLHPVADVGEGDITIAGDCKIHDHAKILPHGGHISIGTHSTVNPFTILYGHGGLDIGEGVRIAAHSTIIPSNHNYRDPDEFIYEQGLSKEGITIKDDVWIGTGCRILDGVTIGEGSVIGAGSVVTHSISPYSVAVGSPAERVDSRDGS